MCEYIMFHSPYPYTNEIKIEEILKETIQVLKCYLTCILP